MISICIGIKFLLDNMLHKTIHFSFHACSVALSVVSFKHPSGKELIDCFMLWEGVTTEVGQSTALVTIATLATTEG